MHGNGEKTIDKKFNGSSRLIATNYAYDKLDQLAVTQRYQRRYFRPWQIILTCLIIVVIINALIMLLCLVIKHQSDNKLSTFSTFIPLNDFRKRTLAAFKLQRPLLSIDMSNNLLILSSFHNDTNELLVEQLALDDYRNGFISKSIKLNNGMRNCQQLSLSVYCCVIITSDDNSSADKGYANYADHFYERNMQMTRTWQTLSNDQTVLLLQNTAGKYSIFDAKHGNLMPILDNEDYSNLTPIASFFGMDNAEELTELAQDNRKFYICEYLRDSQHRFLLQECYETKLLKLEKFSYVKFCANPIYQAIIQLRNVRKTNINWQLQITYISTNDITDNNIYTVDSVDAITDQQIAMICTPFKIDIYLISNNLLVHYTIDLPKVDVETLIGNYF